LQAILATLLLVADKGTTPQGLIDRVREPLMVWFPDTINQSVPAEKEYVQITKMLPNQGDWFTTFYFALLKRFTLAHRTALALTASRSRSTALAMWEV